MYEDLRLRWEGDYDHFPQAFNLEKEFNNHLCFEANGTKPQSRAKMQVAKPPRIIMTGLQASNSLRCVSLSGSAASLYLGTSAFLKTDVPFAPDLFGSPEHPSLDRNSIFTSAQRSIYTTFRLWLNIVLYLLLLYSRAHEL